jgi:hypothetical protein
MLYVQINNAVRTLYVQINNAVRTLYVRDIEKTRLISS